jgi:copper(I)-binding protein
LVIRNSGKTEYRLIGGLFADAGKVQVHEMTMQNGIMKMRQLASGLAIPPAGGN